MRYCSIAFRLNIAGLIVLILLFISAEFLRPVFGSTEITVLDRELIFNHERLREVFPKFADDVRGEIGRYVTANLFALLRIVFAVAITTLASSAYFLSRHIHIMHSLLMREASPSGAGDT